MFLHIGASKNIRESDIIGIFDTDNATVSTVTRKFLADAEKRGEVDAANAEIPKSFVLYRSSETSSHTAVCFSQLASTVLYGRIGSEGKTLGSILSDGREQNEDDTGETFEKN